MTNFSDKKPAETKVSRSDSEHLLAIHPSSRVGSTAAPLPLLDFLGGHSEIYRALHAHTLTKNPKEDLGAREELEVYIWGLDGKNRSKQ